MGRDATVRPAVRHAAGTRFVRRTFQAAFVLLSLWIGARFYFFVRYYETGGQTAFVSRPPGVEGWLPIAGLMNLKYTLLTGVVPDVHPAAMFLLVAFVAISFVARKASQVAPHAARALSHAKGGSSYPNEVTRTKRLRRRVDMAHERRLRCAWLEICE